MNDDRVLGNDTKLAETMAAGETRGRWIGLGLLNNLSAVVSLVTGLVMVPVMLAGLGGTEYGYWIVIVSLAGLVMSADLGLGLIVTREVGRTELGGASSRLARAAGGALLLFGAAGAMVMIALGVAASRTEMLSAGHMGLGGTIFALVGVALFMDQAAQYSIAVMAGRMRFGLANLVLGGGVVLRAVLVVAAIVLHDGLVAVAAAYALGAALNAALAGAAAQRVDRAHWLGRVLLDLRILRPQVRFGAATLVATLAGAVLWHVHPVLIAALVGPAAVVAFHVGMRLPMLVSEMNWRTTEVLFSAVSAADRGSLPDPRLSLALSTGVRWLTLVVLPLAVIGGMLATSILTVWLGAVPPGAETVMRLGLVVVMLDAWSVAATQVLWGLGRPVRTAAVTVVAATLAIGLNMAWLPALDILAAPLAIMVGLTLVAVVNLRAAASAAGAELGRVLLRDVGSLLPAGAAAAAGTLLGLRLAGDGHLARLLLGVLIGVVAYVVAIRYTASVAEERAFVKRAMRGVSGTSQQAVGALRARLKSVAALRSAWYLLLVLRRRLAYRSARTSASLDQLFDGTPDPWRYHSPEESARHAIAVSLLDRVAAQGSLRRVVEIGCAEGVFTESLAPRCDSLLSLDVSEAALGRARKRRNWGVTVTFARFDLLREEIPGPCNTLVVMDVLTYFESVPQLRAIREKLVAALEPGGWLLVGDVRQTDVYETSWWGRRLLCGGYWISEFIAAHPGLRLVDSAETDTHVFRLLMKGS
jgi:O-antigen/teichoic acid export membrane protein/predicted TPR repeat methyltransferase